MECCSLLVRKDKKDVTMSREPFLCGRLLVIVINYGAKCNFKVGALFPLIFLNSFKSFYINVLGDILKLGYLLSLVGFFLVCNLNLDRHLMKRLNF